MEKIHLSPAETLMLNDPITTAPLDLLSYTLAELIFLNVITLKPERIKANRNSASLIKQISIYNGPNFDLFEPEPHHFPFLDPIKSTSRIGLHTLARVLIKRYKESELKDYKKEEVMNSVGRSKRFFSSKDYTPMLPLKRTSLGKKAKREMQAQMKRAKSGYHGWVKSALQSLKTSLMSIGPNLLLVKGVDFSDLVALEKVNPQYSSLPDEYPWPTRYFKWNGMEENLDFRHMKNLDAYIKSFERIFMRDVFGERPTSKGDNVDWNVNFPSDGF